MVTVEAYLLVKAKAIFDDEESNENTVRYLVEQDLEDVGYDVEVSLQSKSEDVAPTPKWFPTSEKLPYKSMWCLVICNEHGGQITRVSLFYRDEFFEGDGKDITRFVTHWMPLPEPPKDGEY